MCGIFACIGKQCPDIEECVAKLKNRGPETTAILKKSCGTFGFTRLAINGLNPKGMQPFTRNGITWICNGEIYNAKALSKEYGIPMPSGSDCEVLGPLYEAHRDSPEAFFRSLDGVFAIILYDEANDLLLWGRDPYGVRPLFAAWSSSKDVSLSGIKDFSALTLKLNMYGYSTNSLVLASERKAVPSSHKNVMQFTPGHWGSVKGSDASNFYMGQYHQSPWLKNPSYSPVSPDGLVLATGAVRFALEDAVKKRLMTERPCAALLSGGIDSSLIAALVQKNLKALGLPPLKTFSIGMPGSTDLFYAKMVAKHIGSDHTEVVLTADDFFAAIPQVINDIESYDITTVRASVGNWLVSKAIRETTDCKVVFNGDGSDEVFGSYLYFYKAPSEQAFEQEVDRVLKEIHYYDVLRSDRTISSHGLEPRTPFLDKQFVAVARSISSIWRRPIKNKQVEKWILRKAFEGTQLLPNEVLWRQKEAFSDGVSSKEKSWFEEIQERVEPCLPSDWKIKALDMTYLMPTTAEAYFYRTLYESFYGTESIETVIPAFWMPRWSPGVTDPSARKLAHYGTASSS